MSGARVAGRRSALPLGSMLPSNRPPLDLGAQAHTPHPAAVGQATQVAVVSGVNAAPLAFVLSADDPSEGVEVWWGDPIPAGGSVSVKVTHDVLSGGMAASDFDVGPVDLTLTAQGVVNADATGYTNSQTLNVSIGVPASPVGPAVRVQGLTRAPMPAATAPRSRRDSQRPSLSAACLPQPRARKQSTARYS